MHVVTTASTDIKGVAPGKLLVGTMVGQSLGVPKENFRKSNSMLLKQRNDSLHTLYISVE